MVKEAAEHVLRQIQAANPNKMDKTTTTTDYEWNENNNKRMNEDQQHKRKSTWQSRRGRGQKRKEWCTLTETTMKNKHAQQNAFWFVMRIAVCLTMCLGQQSNFLWCSANFCHFLEDVGQWFVVVFLCLGCTTRWFFVVVRVMRQHNKHVKMMTKFKQQQHCPKLHHPKI